MRSRKLPAATRPLAFSVETLEARQLLSSVNIFAAGATSQEAIELKIDAQVVQRWDNIAGDLDTGDFVELRYSSEQDIDTSQIKIEFINDVYDPANGIDRNVRIDKIVLDGITFQTEDPSVFSTGTWKPADDVTPGFRQSEFLHANGYLQFANPMAGSLIQVEARGETGEERVALEVEGERVATWQLGTEFSTYTISTDQQVSGSQVRLVFLNDRYDPANNIDRNVQVNRIEIDGTIIEAESDQVFSTGTWNSQDGVTPGFRNDEFLHANGYMQFGLGSVDEVISFDGSGNNVLNPEQGATFEHFKRQTPAAYEDGLNAPSLSGNPNARDVSNAISAQTESVENDRFISSVWFQWGQFLDHEMTRTFTLDHDAPRESFDIDETFRFTRSTFDSSTGITSPREQFNHVSSFIDGSVVYGSDVQRSNALRSHSGGRLASTTTEVGELLPLNTMGLENETGPSPNFFVAGDVRANENVTLTAMQTLFMREHNRLADELASSDFAGRDLNDAAVDEEIFQRAREIVMGLIQNITYNEFLPSTLGFNAIPTYQGYDPTVDASISNEFATAIFRLGHTTLPNEFLIGTGDETISMTEAFVNPGYVMENGIDGIFSGIVRQKMQEVDNLVVDGVRNLLSVDRGGFDLVARNLQRGRDHGLPGYNEVRAGIGLERVDSFHDVISDEQLANELTRIYGTPENADAWIVAISEDHVPGSSVGQTIYAYMVDQFTRLRDGDRFYFENHLDSDLASEIKATRLSDIIERNTNIQVQDEVFWTPDTLVFRNGLDNEWIIRDFGDNGGAEVVFFGTPGVRDPNNRVEIAPVQRDSEVNAIVVAGTNELGDGFFIPNALVSSPLADQGIDEFIITADVDFFEGYGLGGDDRWVIEGDIESVFASGDAGYDILAARNNLDDAKVQLLGGDDYDEITVYAPSANSILVDGGNDDDSIFVFTHRDSEITVRGNDFPVIVTSGYRDSAPKISGVYWSTQRLNVFQDDYYDLTSTDSWFESAKHGWDFWLEERFNREFTAEAHLPNDLDIRHFWSV